MHYPHQATKELTEKYLPNYSEGWDIIKSKRYARLVQLGLMPPGLTGKEKRVHAPTDAIGYELAGSTALFKDNR